MKTQRLQPDTMTIKQKVRQMFQLSAHYYQNDSHVEFTGPLQNFIPDDSLLNESGSIIGVSNLDQIRGILDKYRMNNPNDIPLVTMADVIHGYKTIFPIPLAMSCSWSIEDMELACRVAAKEGSSCGIHVTFAPMADLVRDPRWGRVMESTGEDPYLNGVFSAAAVKGFQNGDVSAFDSMASCVKHFAGYGAAEAGREYNTVDISESILREYYLNGYQKAVEAGCEMVMTGFNTINRVPSTCNKWLLECVLRADMKFDGVVISDWNSIDELISHGVAEKGYFAALKAFTSGVDIDMMSGHYFKYLEEIITTDSTMLERLNESTSRILRLKERLGLFDNQYKGLDEEQASTILLCPEHRASARKVAEDSIVLLENDGILPIETNTLVGLFGSMAETNKLMGGWSCQGKNEDCITLRKALEKRHITLIPPEELLSGVVEFGIAIVVTGEDSDCTGESTSRTSLELPEQDINLVKILTGKKIPTIVVVHSGRPLMLQSISTITNALVQAWFLGTESGNALADLILGVISPQGRLTMTFPRNIGQIPLYYNAFKTGRPYVKNDTTNKYVSKYIDSLNSPLYPFGYGLLYTTMEYSNLQLSNRHICGDESIYVSVDVHNSGAHTGIETIQLYICDDICSIVRPIMELKKFQKARLEAGQKQTICFHLSASDLTFFSGEQGWINEEGTFTVMVGRDACHTLNAVFYWSSRKL